MNIRFVSHASFSLESKGTTLLCDPWLFGKAFNEGWALLSPAAAVPWESINYIWISHQHPDHLHFPTLRSLAPQHRKHLIMLYQKHASGTHSDGIARIGILQRPGAKTKQVDIVARRRRSDVRLGWVRRFLASDSR